MRRGPPGEQAERKRSGHEDSATEVALRPNSWEAVVREFRSERLWPDVLFQCDTSCCMDNRVQGPESSRQNSMLHVSNGRGQRGRKGLLGSLGRGVRELHQRSGHQQLLEVWEAVPGGLRGLECHQRG